MSPMYAMLALAGLMLGIMLVKSGFELAALVLTRDRTKSFPYAGLLLHSAKWLLVLALFGAAYLAGRPYETWESWLLGGLATGVVLVSVVAGWAAYRPPSRASKEYVPLTTERLQVLRRRHPCWCDVVFWFRSWGGYGGQPWVSDPRFWLTLVMAKLLALLASTARFSAARGVRKRGSQSRAESLFQTPRLARGSA
jgi:hypothetical protein